MSGTQTSAPGQLARLDVRLRSQMGTTYSWGPSGDGRRIYIFDTGIRATHEQFGSRVLPGYSAIDGSQGLTDQGGHGTSVASCAAGNTLGVAKDAYLVPLKVLSSASAAAPYPNFVGACEWLWDNHEHGELAPIVVSLKQYDINQNSSNEMAVINQWIEDLADIGLIWISAAGNDAIQYNPPEIPDRHPLAMSIGGARWDADERWNSSSFSPEMAMYAMAQGMQTADDGNDSEYRTWNGTSFAAPQVAGAIAMLAELYPTMPVVECKQAITGLATPGVLSNMGGSGPSSTPNLLLYTRVEEYEPPKNDPTEWHEIATELEIEEYFDEDVEEGQSWEYAVQAYNLSGNSGWSQGVIVNFEDLLETNVFVWNGSEWISSIELVRVGNEWV